MLEHLGDEVRLNVTEFPPTRRRSMVDAIRCALKADSNTVM